MTESRYQALPMLNYIWVGPPTTLNGIPGHDTAGPIHMAQCSANKITFWCLEKYVKNYEQLFNSHNIKVEPIEPYLKYLITQVQNPSLQFIAQQILNIGEETLGLGAKPPDFNRDKIRDRVSFKNIFSLLILYVSGGYVLDTNVRPKEKTLKVELPHYLTFRLPQMPTQSDFWMMYAPKNFPDMQDVMLHYLQKWTLINKQIFLKEGYSEIYYKSMAPLVFSAIENLKTEYWVATKQSETNVYYTLEELELQKRYYNSHCFDNRGEYENKNDLMKDQFMFFASRYLSPHFRITREAKLEDRIKSINSLIWDYAQSENVNDPLMKDLSRDFSCHVKSSQICYAIIENNIPRLNELYALGHPIDEQRCSNKNQDVTPLHVAVIANRPDCVKWLLNKNANPHLQMKHNNELLTPLQLAQKNNRVEICKILEAHLSPVLTEKTSSSPWYSICRCLWQ